MKMLPLSVKLLVSLTFFTAVHLTTEAATSNTCRANAATLPTIPGLPGKDGRPGHNGTDGEQGPTRPQGLSVTYGSPRSHIWTFAAGLSKVYNYTLYSRSGYCNCPCALYSGAPAPSYVGDNFFCESWTNIPYVGLTGVCKWEHLLWSWWSVVHYHTEPRSEGWHWSEDVFNSSFRIWEPRCGWTWDIHLLVQHRLTVLSGVLNRQ